jgi:hypothetical protein
MGSVTGIGNWGKDLTTHSSTRVLSMWHFASPIHLHGMIYSYSGNFIYLFVFVSGETDMLQKEEYHLLGCIDVESGRNSPTF